MSKKETIQEFLKRGGKVTRCDYQPPEETKNTVKGSHAGPPVLYSLDDAAHFFSEKMPGRTKKEVKLDTIDWKEIPDSLQFILKAAKHD